MTKYKELRDEIVSILGTVQLQGSAALAEIATSPKETFTGTPAATVVPAEVNSEVYSVTTNDRAYGFNIHLHYPLNQGSDWAVAIDVMLDLVDGVLNALDQSVDLNGKAHHLDAAPMEWDIAMAGDKLQLLATIHSVARVSVSA